MVLPSAAPVPIDSAVRPWAKLKRPVPCIRSDAISTEMIPKNARCHAIEKLVPDNRLRR